MQEQYESVFHLYYQLSGTQEYALCKRTDAIFSNSGNSGKSYHLSLSIPPAHSFCLAKSRLRNGWNVLRLDFTMHATAYSP